MPPDARTRMVTPEAVELQFETAGVGSRTIALLLDLAVQLTALLLVNVAMALFLFADGGTPGVVLGLVLSALILLGYPIAWETLWRGRTPGKAALGLRVVTREGAPVQFRHAAVRGFLQLVDLWISLGGIGVLALLLTRDNQRLGDLAAGTVVLRERIGASAPQAVRFRPPYGWEGYAARLDTAGLAAGDYAAVRSFLLRAATLPHPVADPLARQLATTVRDRLGHATPPGLGPDGYLACVAAAHQLRGADIGPAAGARAWEPAAAVWSDGPSPVAPPTPAGRDVAPPGPGFAQPG